MSAESHNFILVVVFTHFFFLAKKRRGLCNHTHSYLLFNNKLNALTYQKYYKTYGCGYICTCF